MLHLLLFGVYNNLTFTSNIDNLAIQFEINNKISLKTGIGLEFLNLS